MSTKVDDGGAGLREKLAAIEHERWSDWQKWCHKVLGENMPSDVFQDYVWPILIRWEKQADTAYKDLTDSEKASDMEQVDRYWPLIEQHISATIDRLVEAVQAEKFEQNITRTQDGDLMCDTCGSDVFGGLCACHTANGVINQVTDILLNIKKEVGNG